MRTVDPELWSKKLKKPAMQVSRPMRFGQQAGCRLEQRLRDSLRDALADFWRSCSVAAVKYINASATSCERYGYITLMLLTIAVGSSMVVNNFSLILKQPPLIISLQTTATPITNFKFPAVAVCSNKVISRAALRNYTNYLYKHPKNKIVYGFRRSEIEQNLLNMGALLTFALPPLKVHFENFIRDVESTYNVTDIMLKLSANCSTIMLRCSWRGRLEPCSSLFGTRLTALGFCCVFNSRYQPIDFYRKPAVLDLIGPDYGLGIVVKESRDDFAYVRRPVYGMEVMLIFAGDEYPMLESGDVRMYPLPRNASLFYNIHPLMQYPADDISYYSEKWRGCRLHGGGMSWCLTECRRDTARALCGCVPYAWQPQHARHAPHAPPTCTLGELACLNKHREKFMYLHPGEGTDPALSQERQDAMDCSNCRVLCRRQLYRAQISHSMHRLNLSLFGNFLS
ncbi:sodium channel protein Nach-like [Trichoplusia ni]|uniref:Sodium channel protein Nach-like n=1 Tax=Trichoplusia ni TaxID=7111 RepID=A0A7E5VE24_TRINI|nr:sodium channel protein Nach-like [Trichoplusia ni]